MGSYWSLATEALRALGESSRVNGQKHGQNPFLASSPRNFAAWCMSTVGVLLAKGIDGQDGQAPAAKVQSDVCVFV